VPRLFADLDPADHERATLGSDGARHLRALRLAPGDRFEAILAPGVVRIAVLESLGSRGATLRLRERVWSDAADPVRPLVLVAGLADLPRFDSLIEKATELGASRVAAVHTARSQIGALRESRRARWERIARAACEQCGRTRPPEITAHSTLDGVLASLPSPAHPVVLDAGADLPWDGDAPRRRPLVLFVGPEGGFAPGEVDRLCAYGAQRRSLGPRTLRFETAAAAALAIAGWRHSGPPGADPGHLT